MRLVLDTNVLVSAFITRGAVGEWITEWQNDHHFVTSRPILDELSDTDAARQTRAIAGARLSRSGR